MSQENLSPQEGPLEAEKAALMRSRAGLDPRDFAQERRSVEPI